jgi:hypothetical protein
MTSDPQPPQVGYSLEEIEPLIKQWLRRRLGATVSRTDFHSRNLDAQDLLVEIQLKLLEKAANESAGAAPVRDLVAYAKIVTDSVINDHIRHQRRAWTRVKNRLRRFSEKSRSCSVWEDGSGRQVLGLKAWENRAMDTADGDRVHGLLVDSTVLTAKIPRRHPDALTGKDWETLTHAIIQHLGAPALLDSVVSIVVRLLNVQDPVEIAQENEDGTLIELPASAQLDPYQLTLEKEWRRALWIEIRELLPWQRTAFLLNLPTDYGEIEEFLASGVASMTGIGRALELSDEQLGGFLSQLDLDPPEKQLLQKAGTSYDTKFAVLWKRLPLKDAAIAIGLGVAQASVIGYRNKAKERLRRRMQQAGFGTKQGGDISRG